jgi:hypothetical protein
MRSMRGVSLAIALTLCSISFTPAVAQAASQTVPQSGSINGKAYSSVTYTITSDGRYTVTYHFSQGDQYTINVADAGLFFAMWGTAREVTGSE